MKLKTIRTVLCGALMIGALGLGLRTSLVAQEAAKPAAKAEEKGAKKAKVENRLPNNFAKVGLSDKQRQDIYAVQNKYESQIDDLEKKLADLKAKQATEIEAVLTAEQRKSLQEINDEAKKKAASAKKKAGEKAAESSKEAK